MSLDWNLQKVKDWETVCQNEDRTMRRETEDLLWALLLIGVPDITDKSSYVVFDRLEQYRIANGRGAHEGTPLERIRQHVGMTTNVAKKTAREFDAVLDRCRRETCGQLARKRDQERAATTDTVTGAKMEVQVKVTAPSGQEQTLVVELQQGATLRTLRDVGMLADKTLAASPTSQFELRGRIKKLTAQ